VAGAQTAAQVPEPIRSEQSGVRAAAAELPPVDKKPSETGPQKRPQETASTQKPAFKLPAAEQTPPPATPVSQQKTSKPAQPASAPAASKLSAEAASLNTKAAALAGKEPPPTANGPASNSAKAPPEHASEAYAKQGSGPARSKPSDAGEKKNEAMTPPAGKAGAAGAAQSSDKTSTVTADTSQLALLKGKTGEKAPPEMHSAAGSTRRPLEAYVVQVRFDSRADAQRWAETIQRRGYPVSLTEAGAASVRLRFGNFPLREDAERQLGVLKKEGLTGIIVTLPGGYRPDSAALNGPAD
jgi:hypothetical protein